MKKLLSPRFMLISSMVIFGTLSIFVRNISVSSGELALWRALIASVLIGAYLLITGQKVFSSKIKKRNTLASCFGRCNGF